jgi:hypothetical protein
MKENHRSKCLQKLQIINKIMLPPKFKSIHETVLIEFRPFPHLEFLIKNMILQFPYWSHTVVCGVLNESLISSWNLNINIIKLPIQNLTPSSYSSLLLTPHFWKQFKGEHLLIYQEDSMIFHNKIQPFLMYDYVGAPWPVHQNDNKVGVGNGGFSLRKKSAMLKCLETVHPSQLKLEKSTLDYIKTTNSTCVPEDVYFSKTLIDYGIGSVAPRNVALEFSQETQQSEHPLGGHQYWLANDIPFAGVKLGTDYHTTVTHRWGWKKIIQNLQPIFSKGILLIDCMEQYFMWDKKQCTVPWIGIAHYSPNLPSFLNKHSLESLMENAKQSLPHCKGIIVMSKNSAKVVEKYTNTIVLNHPIPPLSSNFNLEKFKKATPYVIQLGCQDRITTFIYQLKTTYPKIWMPGHKRSIVNTIKTESEFLNIKVNLHDVKLLFTENNAEYDQILQTNIIIIPLWSASANNSILEIISMKIPAFITRLPATEEYLGKNYPMFFTTKEEIETILSNKTELFRLYEHTYIYLCNLNIDLTFKTFQSKLLYFCLY